MDKAAHVLGMSKKAFDLMIAGNIDIFRRIGNYDGRWHLPTRYLQELSEKEGFDVVKEKYEFMAKICGKSFQSMKHVSRVSPKPTGEPSQHAIDQGLPPQALKPSTQATGREGFSYPWGDFILPESYSHGSIRFMVETLGKPYGKCCPESPRRLLGEKMITSFRQKAPILTRGIF
jgi:hypothetical protein